MVQASICPQTELPPRLAFLGHAPKQESASSDSAPKESHMESRPLTPRSRPWKKWTSGCARSGSWHTRSSSERLRPRGITVSHRTMASSGYDSSSSCRMGPKGKRKYRLLILLQRCPGAGTRQLQEFRVLEITPSLIGEVAKDSLPKFPGEERVGVKIHTHIPAPVALSIRMSPDTLETGSSRVT